MFHLQRTLGYSTTLPKSFSLSQFYIKLYFLSLTSIWYAEIINPFNRNNLLYELHFALRSVDFHRNIFLLSHADKASAPECLVRPCTEVNCKLCVCCMRRQLRKKRAFLSQELTFITLKDKKRNMKIQNKSENSWLIDKYQK